MAVASKTRSRSRIVQQMMALESDMDRRTFLSQHPALLRGEVVQRMAPLVVAKIRVDARKALRLAETLVIIARQIQSKECEALALRAKANALYACGENRGAVEHHDEAYTIFASLGNSKEAARTLSSSIQPLILSGQYDRAFAAAREARELFAQLGEHKRIASLENNLGNIFHRQDRFEEAIAHYELAFNALSDYEEWERAAVALSNMAMCLISLNDFSRSLDCYQRARELCEKYGMPRLRDQADYNIAYLYYLRGEYARAIDMLLAARRACEANGDAYHVALCYVDLSDIYLELNLNSEAREMAHDGFVRFQKLGMGYEAAKALANEAIAYGKQGETDHALRRLAKARQMFRNEKNVAWPWLVDLYQALLLFRERRYQEAWQLSSGAATFFDSTLLSGKAVIAHLLLARIALELRQLDTAATEAEFARVKLSDVEAPLVAYEVRLMLGHIARARGDSSGAHINYQQARTALERLRTRLQREELKISFVRNRLEVYEALVDLHLSAPQTSSSAEETFACMEAAKSRSMVETLFEHTQNVALSAADSEHLRPIRDLRAELNWYYHRIEIEQLRPEGTSQERIDQLKREARSRESLLQQKLRELPVQQGEAATVEAVEFSLEKLQSALPRETALIEYFSAGDRLIAAVVTREATHFETLGSYARVAELLHLLRFQLSKFRMGPIYTRPFQEPLLHTTRTHLQDLHNELVKPLLPISKARHLIFVPHGPLHFLPFHALRNAQEYLGDIYTISYAPSAALFTLCQEKVTPKNDGALVFGIPDEWAPNIADEAGAVAALLPNSELHLGESATSEILRNRGSQIGHLHIATHGVYRQDNPMFSAIRLGDGYLNLYDLYQLRINAKLVALSGCATGMNVVAAGDELLGLQRGLFYAGATSVLLSLWDVHDRSTAELMQEFYRAYMQSGDMAGSLQSAMRCLRQENPHPYFWAPFVLIGKVDKPIAKTRDSVNASSS